jgi:DNA-directed RNA polymerase subunit H (RpoH/RPB5)
MHILQPKHIKLNEKESEELLKKLNISKSQLPKILLNDPALPEGC